MGLALLFAWPPSHRFLVRLAVALAAILVAGYPAFGQSRPSARLGMLFEEPVTAGEIAAHPTLRRLSELGWVEGRNLSVVRAEAGGHRERLPELAARLLAQRPDVLWVDDFDAAAALAALTTTIPIVFCGVARPVEQGLIQSYARPGRNVTGVANTTGIEMSTKRMQMLKEIASSGRRLAWLIPGYGLQSAEGKQIDLTPYEKEARRLGLEVTFYFIAKGEDIDAAFRDIVANKADMLSVGSNPLMIREQGRIVALANAHRLPSAFLEPSFVAAGGLLSFGPDRLDARRKTAEYVDRILKGANPATMPVEQPQRFSIAINLRTARALGLTIPASIRLGADLVVE